MKSFLKIASSIAILYGIFSYNSVKANALSWEPTKQLWEESVLLASEALEKYKTNNPGLSYDKIIQQSKIDAVLWYNTMFTNFMKQTEVSAILSQTGISHDRIQKKSKNQSLKENFLKRLFLLSIMSNFKYISNQIAEGAKINSTSATSIEWPYPVSLIYSHGTRVLVKIGGNQNTSETIFNWLTTGNQNTEPSFTHLRSISSHGTAKKGDCSTLSNASCEIKELKQTSFSGVFKSATDSLRSQHRYINVALGGLGYLDYFNNIISYNGHRIKRNKNNQYVLDESTQHGHVYTYLGPASLLIGVESSAPGKHDMFEKNHDFTSGFKDSTELPSPTGGPKMQKLLGTNAPSQYNGMMVYLEEQDFELIKEKIRFILEQPSYKQALLFQELLLKNISHGKNIINSFIQKNSPPAQ